MVALLCSEMVWRAWRGAWKLGPHKGVTLSVARLTRFKASSVSAQQLWSGMWLFTYGWDVQPSMWMRLYQNKDVLLWHNISPDGSWNEQCSLKVHFYKENNVQQSCEMCTTSMFPWSNIVVCRWNLCQQRFDFFMCLGWEWCADGLIAWCLLFKLDLGFWQWWMWLFFSLVSFLAYISFFIILLLQVWGFFENLNTNLKCLI